MTSKEALHDLFTEANRVNGEVYNFRTDELLVRRNLIERDLEVLEILKKIISQCSFEVGKEKYKSFYDDKYVYEIWIRQGKDMILLNLDEKEGEIMKEWIEK